MMASLQTEAGCIIWAAPGVKPVTWWVVGGRK